MKVQTLKIAGHPVKVYRYNTVIVGSGAAGMNCAVHLYELMAKKGVERPQDRIAIITRGQKLGASRMSGSDKQTFYKMGTSPYTPDSAEQFSKSLTAGGCTHEDLALAEGVGSLREFYHLVRSGVPFPHDSMGVYVGYKTDHDPYERATSAGPKTSKFMSECLQREAERYGIKIHDRQEVAEFLTAGGVTRGMGVPPMCDTGILPVSLKCPAVSSSSAAPEQKQKQQDMGKMPLLHMGKMPMPHRIIGVVALDCSKAGAKPAFNVFLCENLVLAAGGPGELYKTSVYPAGQVGLHGLALKAGLAAENFTESQFGLASVKFRWNVSGTYMQVVPRIFSTAADGQGDPRDFLCGFFPSMSKMASDIFLKGYQWPFDPQRIENHQSSLIDMLVFNETQQGRRVFMDFRENPRSGTGILPVSGCSMGILPVSETVEQQKQQKDMAKMAMLHTGKMPVPHMRPFVLDELESEALEYLRKAGATQARPIDRLEHMNPLAIEIYREHGIDLHAEPLEIALCAQHQNGGLAVNKWWESSTPHTFVVGEMAGTHGVKRPGGAALNSGQVGGLRAAMYIGNVYGAKVPAESELSKDAAGQVERLIAKLASYGEARQGLNPAAVIEEIQARVTACGGHIREINKARAALAESIRLYRQIEQSGLRAAKAGDRVKAVQAGHLALTAVALLRAIVAMLEQGAGSRGSHLVLADDGVEIHPAVVNPATGKPMRFKRENLALRSSILRIQYDPDRADLFQAQSVPIRQAPTSQKSFEPAWADFREGKVFRE
jgi:succinate dehydrogenase/fumarate reductase flavoprotein subunit